VNPTGATAPEARVNSEFPNQFNLSQNFPNPFSAKTNILISLPETSLVKLKIFDS
jgi:hypothetical protein